VPLQNFMPGHCLSEKSPILKLTRPAPVAIFSNDGGSPNAGRFRIRTYLRVYAVRLIK
jgi:hypothetical protein